MKQQQREAVHAYLMANGPASTATIAELFSKQFCLQPKTFRNHLTKMQTIGLVKNIGRYRQPGIWRALPIKKAPAPTGEIAPPRQFNVMTAPPLVAIEMQVNRPGAANAERYASRRGDELVPHRQPIHMCSQLKGSM